MKILIVQSQESLQIRLEELDEKNKNIEKKIDDLNFVINKSLQSSGHHSIQPLMDYATAVAIFIENAVKFKQKIKIFEAFVSNYKNNLILKKEFLIIFMKDNKDLILNTRKEFY